LYCSFSLLILCRLSFSSVFPALFLSNIEPRHYAAHISYNSGSQLVGYVALNRRYAKNYFSFPWRNSPYWARASSLWRLHDHTQTHPTQ
jgi:hypothetical protein